MAYDEVPKIFKKYNELCLDTKKNDLKVVNSISNTALLYVSIDQNSFGKICYSTNNIKDFLEYQKNELMN